MVVNFIIPIVCVSVYAFAASAMAESQIVRLFTSPEDRLFIEQQKRLLPINQQSVNEVRQTKKLSLDAVLIGKKTVIWVNRQMIDRSVELNGVIIDPNNATAKGLWISTTTGRKLLRQGQVYLTELGKVVERYEAL